MSFDEEPEWMKKARTVPLRSTWDSRQPAVPATTRENAMGGRKAAMS